MERYYARIKHAPAEWFQTTLARLDSAADIVVFPVEGLGGFGIEPDIAQELTSEIGYRGEDPASDNVSLHLGEPDFNLVQPRGVRGSKMKPHGGMLVEECSHQRSFLGAEVVENDMDLPIRRLGGDHFTQKRHKLLLVWREAPVDRPVDRRSPSVAC